jgi:RNA polymerase sigma-70 factor, ECF subfamily
MSSRDTALSQLTALQSVAEADVSFRMDEDAFRGFYDRTARPLHAYLQRLTGSHSAADDLLQDAYYRFLRATASLQTDAHRRHYLFRIATNLAADSVRRRRTHPPETGADPDLVPAEASAARLDRRMDLENAMGRLRVRERAMLWLAYTHGATHEEIAVIVGVRTSSIKPLLSRARRKLAVLLDPERGREDR